MVNCMPLPGAQGSGQSERGPIWRSRWGAIAIDFGRSNAGIGVSVNASSKRKAKNEAMADCRAKGGQNCRINLIYDNQCAVVVAGTGYGRSQGGATVEIAAAYGLRMCEKAGIKDCQIYYKACSLPVQVR